MLVNQPLNPNDPNKNQWGVELTAGTVLFGYHLKEISLNTRSKYQEVLVGEHDVFGKLLFLEGHLQSASQDEFIYHESLIHPPMLLHPNPKVVFVAGGGEGAVAREIFRHKSVEKCYLVDIDETVVDISRKYLTTLHEGAYEDPRMVYVAADAKEHLETKVEDSSLDVMFMDLPEPTPGSPANLLYTQNYFLTVLRKLKADGVLALQCGPGSVTFMDAAFASIHSTLKTVFKNVNPWTVEVPSFFDSNSFCLASNVFSLDQLSAEELDKRIEERITNGSKALKHLDGQTIKKLFVLTKAQRKILSECTQVITEENQICCFGK